MELAVLSAAALGAICQELAHWYDLRKHLHQEEHARLLGSRGYWTITVLMIVVTPLAVQVWFGERPLGQDVFFLLGAAFPLILKKGMSTVVQQVPAADGPLLGAERAAVREFSPARAYFRLHG